MLWPGRVEEEDGDIDDFDYEPKAIDCNDKAIWMDEGHSIETPHCATEYCCYIRIRLKAFHCSRLVYFDKCWAAIYPLCTKTICKFMEQSMREREREITWERYIKQKRWYFLQREKMER